MTTAPKDFTDLLRDLRAAAQEQIDTANLILTRVRNAAVVGDATGHVILLTGGLWPIPVRIGDVARFRTMADAKAEAAAQNEIQDRIQFQAMTLHQAARLQLTRATKLLADLEDRDQDA